MEKIFLPLYNFFQKHRVAMYASLVLSFLCIGFFASKIKLEEDITAVLPKDAKTEKLQSVFQNSKFLDKLVIQVSAVDSSTAEPDSLVAFTERYVEKIQLQLAPYINHINDKVNDELLLDMFNNIQQQLPIYLNNADYRLIDSLTEPVQLQETLARNIQTLSSPAGLALKKMISNDPVGISFIALKKLQQLQYDENFDLYDGYVITKDKKHLLFFISPKYPPNNTGKNIDLLKGLDAIMDTLHSKSFPNISASYYGATAVSAGNALQIRKDNFLTQGIAIIFIVVFVAWFFRKKTAPVVMLLPVAFGALFSLAIIYLLKGKISVIALGTGSVVLGIAINYSLHVFNHYRHTKDIRTVLQDLSTPMTIGSFTTIGGFFCLQFVQSDLLKDVGLFAAFSLVGASFFSLVFLPHLIVTKKEQEAKINSTHSLLDKIALRNPERNKWIIAGIAILTIVFAYTSRYASFESDMMRMNYLSPQLKKAEAELNRINAYALQSVYIVASGKTLDEALAKNEAAVQSLQQLKASNIVQRFSGVEPIILSRQLQQQKINKWNSYWTDQKKQQVLHTLVATGKNIGYKATAFDSFKVMLDKQYIVSPVTSNNAILQNLLEDYIIEKPGETMIVNLVKTTQQNKAKIYNTFETQEGITVIDKQYLTNKLVESVNADFTSIAIMSSLLVFIVLLITYGRIELALVTFIPMLITWVWILGIMGIFGIQFNIINIIISTLIFGLGDDYSIFIMDGLLQEYKTGKRLLASYKSSIFISAITTIAGLGVLIFAKHPALRSIALISIIGMFCVVIMSQILIPFFFNLLIKNRVEKKKFPWTVTSFLKSAFAFSYFIFGCILLNILGLFLIKLNPFNKAKSKLIYHTVLSKFAWSLMHIMTNVKKTVNNPLNESFETPAIVIANHQSFLDILCTIMLHPKLLLLTNSWVYHSPFFGNVVRMAGYYPVKEGAEQSTDKLRQGVADGYSIVVFPEGTRSADGNIKRFHKGAFFLAEQLNIDILPILIHGSGYSMGKSDFLLKDGDITLQYLPRIQPGDKQWGEGYAIRGKKISAYFRQAYQQLKARKETPDFFRETLHYNYLYKGPVLEWYMRIKVSLEKNYKQFEALVPKQGHILDVGCGFGFLSYMLHFTSTDRTITGIDYDEEKIATANHCFSKTADIAFIHADALLFNFAKYNAIILSDILHYLQPDEQENLVIKCIKHLHPNGVIIIRDGNAELEKRHRGTRLSEFFSTKLLGFNKTSTEGLSFLHANSIHKIAATNNMECKELDESKFTSNIIFILKDKAPVAQYETRH
jgi:1-acyl-sn-glycerol-3-phosphate acyltransferase